MPTPESAAVLEPQIRVSGPPVWDLKLMADWRGGIAHEYLVVGPNDYVMAGLDAADFLAYQFGGDPFLLPLVVRYALDTGITFLQPSMRPIFDRVLGLDAKPQGDASLFAARAEQLLGMPIAFDGDSSDSITGGTSEGPPLPRKPAEAIEMLIRLNKTIASCACGYIHNDQGVAEHVRDRGQQRENGHEAEVGRPRSVAIIERADLLVPPADKAMMQQERLQLLGMLHRAGTDIELEAKGNPIVLIAPSMGEIHTDLRAASSGIQAIEIPPADYDDRLEFIHYLLGTATGEPKYPVRLAMTPAQLAAMTAGLFRRHIEDLFLRAKAAAELAGLDEGVLDEDLVVARKREVLASEYAGVLVERKVTHTMADVGGHEAQKQHLYDWVITPLINGWVDMAPKGILFTGPAGTGKTFTIDAVAAALKGWNIVELRPDAIRSKWQGESERLFAKATLGIVGFAPVVVLIDEAETKFSRGDGTNTAETNLMGMLLELMGRADLRGRVLFGLCTNWPNRMDAALVRPGRVDLKLPFLPPATASERADTIASIVRRFGHTVPDVRALLEIGNRTEDWTQAELERAVVKAAGLVRLRSCDFAQALQDAVRTLRPATKDIKLMTDLALQACDDDDLLPEKYRSRLENRDQLEEQIEQRLQSRERVRGSRRIA